MRFTFSQSSGIICEPDGRNLYTGYSGRGDGRSNPSMQHIRLVGPLPQGLFRIGSAFECSKPIVAGETCPNCHGSKQHEHGPDVLRLTPIAAPENPVYTEAQAVIVAQLTAAGHPEPWMFGRAGFLTHGDNVAHTASEGCIIAGHLARCTINESAYKELEVTN